MRAFLKSKDARAGEHERRRPNNKKALEIINRSGDCKAIMDTPRLRPPSGPRLDLASRLQYVPGVGPARALAFERLGLTTVEHLLRHYPRSYLDARRFVRVKDLRPDELLTVVGTVKSAAALRTRAGRTDF